MDKVIIILAAFSADIFFVIASIIGYRYEGIENSRIYVVYAALVAASGVGLLVVNIVASKRSRFSWPELTLLFLLPLTISLLYIKTVFEQEMENYFGTLFFIYFLLWGVPAIYVAVYVNRKMLLIYLAKWMEVLMLLISLSVIVTSLVPLALGGGFVSLGGATYQTASYLAAFAFGLNLYFLFYGKNHVRFSFAKTKKYSLLCYGLILAQVTGMFLSGGRGGLVLLAAYLIYLIFSKLTMAELKATSLKLFWFVLLCAFGYFLIPELLNNQNFASGFNRAIEFISSDGGINWDGTSNREEAYSAAIDLIKDRPFFGYGLFGFWSVSGYPHNIFLEVLLNGGVVYLTLFLVTLLLIFLKLRKMIRMAGENRLILIIAIYPFTMLMFSGSYMANPAFWFVLALVMSYRIKAVRLIRQSD